MMAIPSGNIELKLNYIDRETYISRFVDGLFTIPKFDYQFYLDPATLNTFCLVEIDGKKSWGVARLHPKDKFNYRTGRKVALTNVLKSESKPVRKLIWNHYWKKNKDGE